MKKTIYLILSLLLSSQLFANNLVIGTPVYDGVANTLTFTVKWDNSWRVVGGPTNYDAVWLFVKRQPCGANGIWSHGLLSSTSANHTVSGTNANGLVIDAVSDGMGVFVHLGPNANNQIISSLTATTIVLKLSGTYNPSLTGASSAAADNWKVFGFEMVYVPEGEFYAGDGRSSNSSNFSAGNTASALKITSALQAAGLGVASNYTSSAIYGCSVPLPATYPIGYNGFYCMKYEILQGQIADFYNCLTYDQQAARLKISSNRLLSTVNSYFGENLNSLSLYNSTTGTSSSIPATIATAYPHIPRGYMNWQDLTAYLDWSGLRPMTEFEYEKACRGTATPIPYEYPWGSTVINGGNTNVINYNVSATATWPVYDGACNNWQTSGPIRAGFAASATSNRSQAGATYYGIMEMAGNVFEQCVGGGAGYDYSSFTTTNGNGALTLTSGLADVVGWPTNGGAASGTIVKGGWFNTMSNYYIYQVSDRTWYNGAGVENYATVRSWGIGGRGVRSF